MSTRIKLTLAAVIVTASDHDVDDDTLYLVHALVKKANNLNQTSNRNMNGTEGNSNTVLLFRYLFLSFHLSPSLDLLIFVNFVFHLRFIIDFERKKN